MNSPQKVIPVLRMLFALLVLAIALVLLFKAASHPATAEVYQPLSQSEAQDPEKSLDIERYPNEPLELVDLQIRQISVKQGIKFKSKDSINQWGLDNVKFKEKEDWFKNVKIRLRNVSGRTIYGVDANVFITNPSSRMLFGISLKPAPNRNLRKDPLQAGDELDFEVSEASLKDASTLMIQYGVDPARSPVSLSVDSAMFGDDLRWSRGKVLRRDSSNPAKWDAVDKPVPITSSNWN